MALSPVVAVAKRKHRARRARSKVSFRQRFQTPQGRRSLVLVGGSVLVSTLVLVAWFPASALLHQRQALAATTSAVNQLHQQDQALVKERQRQASAAEIERIARQQYQLVIPGEQPYEVLPRNDAGSSYPGDPANDPLDAPNASSELPPGTGTTSTKPHTAAHHGETTSGSPSLLSRIVHTLEFWR
jgi:cell division protein FtsB